VLTQLREEQYGYSLKRSLAEKGFEIDEGTLYPLLRRLEGQGLLKSTWRVEDGRPRRYYQLNAQGKALLADLGKEWTGLARAMERLLK
jgi:DNA-binding PadR family transcriptional regulator